jgi:hypothetical protein
LRRVFTLDLDRQVHLARMLDGREVALINSDVMRSAAFVELRRLSAELNTTSTSASVEARVRSHDRTPRRARVRADPRSRPNSELRSRAMLRV